MFHRVKPETQDTQEQQKQQQAQAAKPAEVKSFQTPSPAQAAQARPAQRQDQTNPQQSNQQKDTQSMNAQTDNNQEQASTEQGSRPDIPSGAYRAPGARTPSPRPGGYPGAYPGAASYSTKPSPLGGAGTASDRTLTIGAGITMSGEIESCDYLLVEGTVEASLKGASVLEIAESGVFYGTVEIDEANVAGRFEGDITVNGRLTIRSTGTITGSISYKELEVESGAVIDGRLTPVGAAAQSAKQGKKPQGKSGRKEDQEAANSDDTGLFAKTAAE